ncbi:MAG TPA: cytochrome C oxidase subunit IV family protein [candidate division Zixibacteria bacterium]|nr:cytochrome C oxidase subunit IV family protein [candidate division Zixibacteria bacterium]
MSDVQTRHYLTIWIWLLALATVSVAAAWVLPKVAALSLIFMLAFVKALLVARDYMHLKYEKAITYAIVLVPLAFVILLLFALFPDFAYRPRP